MQPFIIQFSEPTHENTLYLDKDGVLNIAFYRNGKLSSPRSIDEIKVKKDLEDILNFSRNKFNLVVISNQPDLSRGLITEKFLLENLLQVRNEIPLTMAFFCPHLKIDNCNCRKPKCGSILKFRKLYPRSYEKELFIGDQETDALCAKELNIPFLKVCSSTSLFNNIADSLSSEKKLSLRI